MRTTKIFVTVFLFSLISVHAMAQHDRESCQEKKERIEALKVSFITQKLDLTKEEAQVFWPVYNEYQDEKHTLRNEKWDDIKDYKSRWNELSDQEIATYVDKKIIYEQRKLDIKKKYHAEFKEVLPMKKVALLYKAEDEFRKHLLNEAKMRKAH